MSSIMLLDVLGADWDTCEHPGTRTVTLKIVGKRRGPHVQRSYSVRGTTLKSIAEGMKVSGRCGLFPVLVSSFRSFFVILPQRTCLFPTFNLVRDAGMIEPGSPSWASAVMRAPLREQGVKALIPERQVDSGMQHMAVTDDWIELDGISHRL